MCQNFTFKGQNFTLKGQNESKCVKISGIKVKMSHNFSSKVNMSELKVESSGNEREKEVAR